jgi:hypothetical protein
LEPSGENSAARFFSAIRHRNFTVKTQALERAVVPPAGAFRHVHYWKPAVSLY